MHAFFQPRKPKASQHTDSDSSKAIKGDDNVESANNEKENTEATSAKTQKLSTSKISKLATPEECTDDLPSDLKGIITWESGSNIPYSAVCNTFEKISEVPERLKKEKLFCNLFRAVVRTCPDDLKTVIYLASNSISPAYEGLELGIGDSLLIKAIVEATGRKKESVEEAYKTTGDLGLVALQSRQSQKTLSFVAKPKPLMANEILEKLIEITKTKGDKAQGRKVNIIKSLMVRCVENEAKFLIRALQGKLRIGTAAQTVLVALGHAFAHPDIFKKLTESEGNDRVTTEKTEEKVYTEGSFLDLYHKISDTPPPEVQKLKSGKKLQQEDLKELAVGVVKRAFSECPNYDILAQALLSHPLHSIGKMCSLATGIPVAPMLAKPTKEIGEVLKRLQGLAFTMEYKYDGERAQVHLQEDGAVKIFSRNSEDNTNKYPDLLDHIYRAKNEHVTSCVIDAEVVAYDRERGCLLPFQVLSTRKRKVDEGTSGDEKVKVVLQAFDILHINGKSLLGEPLRNRRNILNAAFHLEEGYFHFATGMDHKEDGDTLPIETFMTEACNAACEGLMVKTLDDNATYEPSKRSMNWLKLKKDYIDGMGVCDSVDLVVIGGYFGHGKRTNVYGAYLMACYDAENDEFQSVCKVGTGFKDDDLARLNAVMLPHVIESSKKPINYNVGDPLYPDHWFQPTVVWELQAADLSKSSVHRGGYNSGKLGGRGIGLRFPRYIRDREDKKPENATSSEQITEMYLSQPEVGGENDANGGDDDYGDDLI